MRKRKNSQRKRKLEVESKRERKRKTEVLRKRNNERGEKKKGSQPKAREVVEKAKIDEFGKQVEVDTARKTSRTSD